MATEWVRVQHKGTGHQYSVSAQHAEANNDLKALDSAAVDINGRPLPAKLHVALADLPKPTAAQSKEDKKP